MNKHLRLVLFLIFMGHPASAQFGSSRLTTDLAEWLSSVIVDRPDFARSFGVCQSIVSKYEDALIQRLTAEAYNSHSTSQQQQLSAQIQQLVYSKEIHKNVTCLKQFFSALQIEGAASGVYRDELSRLNGKLADLNERAKARFDDLTDAGLNQLTFSLALNDVGQQALSSEINAVTRSPFPNGSGYLACLIPRDWTSWFSSAMGCDTPALDSLLSVTAATMRLH